MVYLNLGAASANSGNYDAAGKYYQKALELDSESGPAYKGLALIFYNRQQFDKARKYLDLALRYGAEVEQGLKETIRQAG
jgi:tetratricopeptide (TPR) repeat protein